MIVTATQEVRKALGGEALRGDRDPFPRLESPSLRLEKFVCLGHARKKEEIDAVVMTCKAHAGTAKMVSPAGSKTLVMKLGGRLIINQAGGVLENAGLCLHRHFGYPYIPGSAVKGCARHAAWCRWDEAEGEEKRELAMKIAFTFGFPTAEKGLDADLKDAGMVTRAGCVAFLPAVPNGQAKLVTDIVNCHHKDYYGGKKDRATDDESPVPNFFPAVDDGASFVFTLVPVSRRSTAVERDHGFNPADFALDMLKEAVEFYGVGAKTAAGYGWFEEDEDGQANLEKAAREAEDRKRAVAAEAKRQEALAAMSPEDRRVEELGELERDVFIAQCINPLATKDESEQRAILRALLEKFPQTWLDDKTAKPKKKGGKRAVIVRDVAGKLGVELP